MKNKHVNKILKKIAIQDNKKTYFVRTGKCNPEKCQSACCRIDCVIVQNNFHDTTISPDFTFKGRFGDYFVKHKHCESLTLDGKCKKHNKKSQLPVCKYFPMTPTDGVYDIVKKYCGLKFYKVKNEKYKKGK